MSDRGEAVVGELPVDSIVEGDCVEVLRGFPAASVDLVLTSPPYDDLRSYGGFSLDVSELISELWRVVKPGGVVVWVVADATKDGSETGTSMRQALAFMERGFLLHDTMIYHKDNPPPVGGSSRYYQAWEYMFVFSRGRPKTFNPLMRPQRNKWNDKRTSRVRSLSRDRDGAFGEPKTIPIRSEVKRSNVWRYVVSGGSVASDSLAHHHPAVFPETLAHDHIVSWTNPGDVVLDPMVGSGTVTKVARALGRRWIGVELNPEYVLLARSRTRQAYGYREAVHDDSMA